MPFTLPGLGLFIDFKNFFVVMENFQIHTKIEYKKNI